jgi:hypothetical protein
MQNTEHNPYPHNPHPRAAPGLQPPRRLGVPSRTNTARRSAPGHGPCGSRLTRGSWDRVRWWSRAGTWLLRLLMVRTRILESGRGFDGPFDSTVDAAEMVRVEQAPHRRGFEVALGTPLVKCSVLHDPIGDLTSSGRAIVGCWEAVKYIACGQVTVIVTSSRRWGINNNTSLIHT